MVHHAGMNMRISTPYNQKRIKIIVVSKKIRNWSDEETSEVPGNNEPFIGVLPAS